MPVTGSWTAAWAGAASSQSPGREGSPFLSGEVLAMSRARIHLLYGLLGSGKPTLARELEQDLPAVRFTLDEWILRLDPELRYDSAEYGSRVEQVKDLIWSVAAQVLATGTDVVLDWNSWSRERRRWVTVRALGHPCRPEVCVHWLTTGPEVAAGWLAARAAAGSPHSHAVCATDNEHLATLMEPPEEDEGLTLFRA